MNIKLWKKSNTLKKVHPVLLDKIDLKKIKTMFRFNFVILAAGKNSAMNIGIDATVGFKISSIIFYVQKLYKTFYRFFGRFNGIINNKPIIVDNNTLISFCK